MNHNKHIYILFAAFSLIVAACSTSHNTWYSRHYQMLTSEFNVLFNGNEAFKGGIEAIRSQYKNDYSRILPIYEFSDEKAAAPGSADMETALKKAHKLIQLHSITVKPETKKNETEKDKRFKAQEEFNPLVDDAYLLIGKANVVKHEDEEAIEVFDFISRKFPNDKTAYEGKIWKAIAYTQMGQPTNAMTALESYDLDGLAPVELYGQYMAAYANVLIAEEKYPQAIHYMEEAVKNADSKHNRLRYKYILAQLYRHNKQNDKAAPLFLELSKGISDYDMAFAAKLDLATVATTPEEIALAEKKLARMTKDEKNVDQLDEIYYAIGKMDENRGDTNKALIDYQRSIDASTVNMNQKGLSFLAKTDIYMAQPNDANDKFNMRYLNAGESADSAATYLEDRNLRKKEAQSLSKQLNALTQELRTIKEQDSLLRVANMSSKEREKLIESILEKIEKEQQARREAAEAAEEEGMSQSEYYNLTRNSTGQSGAQWYFYNTTMVNAGKSTFMSKWGRRANEDNWRRADKSSSTFRDAESEDEFTRENDKSKAKDGTQNEPSTDEPQAPTNSVVTRESLLANLPLTTQQQAETNNRIDNALFGSGVIFYDELKDYPSAIKQLEALLARNPQKNCDNCYDALVMLYFAQMKNGDSAGARSTASTIKALYAETELAKYLSQNNYFDQKSAELAEKESRYKHAYEAYLHGDYSEAITSATRGLNIASDTAYSAKYLLVRSLSYAKQEQSAAFRADLTEITSKYPGGEEDEMARKLLALLDEGRKPIKATDYKSPLAEAGKGEEAAIVEIANFTFQPDTTHSIVCVIDKGMQNEAQFTIADYNFTNYLLEDLDIKTTTLADKRQIVVVSGFDNMMAAMNYFYAIRDKDFWKKLTEATLPEIYAVSDNNLKLVLLTSISNEYVEFFNKQYLNR